MISNIATHKDLKIGSVRKEVMCVSESYLSRFKADSSLLARLVKNSFQSSRLKRARFLSQYWTKLSYGSSVCEIQSTT